MRMTVLAALTILIVPEQLAAEEISVERGRVVSIISGCHDCHTEGYSQSGGKIDPEKEMRGSSIGWRGPWGTTYAINVRLWIVGKGPTELTEDFFVSWLKTDKTAFPPMPWYNLHFMPEADLRSLYRYIKSLGDPGEPAPVSLPPGQEPKTPYVVLVPPQMPPPCSRDLDCGVGLVCSTDEPRACVPH